MKRLMFLAILIATSMFGQVSIAGQCKPTQANGYKTSAGPGENCNSPAGAQEHAPQPTPAMSQVSQNGGLYKHNGNVTPFVPSDLVFARPEIMGFDCDENGMRSQPRPNSGCADYVSKDGSKWRLRKVEKGTVESIFRLSKGGTLQLHVRFAGNGDVHRVVKISPEAEKMAEANGYQFNGTTAVAIGSVTPTPPNIDCNSSLNINDRLTCVKRGGNGAGAPSTASTTPVEPAQGPDCSQLRGVMKVKCDAAASLAKAKGALPDIPTGAIVKQ